MIYELFQPVMVVNINYLSSMGKLGKYVPVSDIKAIIHEKATTDPTTMIRRNPMLHYLFQHLYRMHKKMLKYSCCARWRQMIHD